MVSFFSHIDIFLLIMVRLLAFFIIVPVLSGLNVPMTGKIGLAFAAACLVYSSGRAADVWYAGTAAGYVAAALKEFLAGFAMGYAVYLVFSLILFAGQLMDFQIGFSMASAFDPMTQTQVPIVGNLLYLAVCALLVQTGGLNAFLGAVFYSFDALPPGQAVVLGNADLARRVLEVVGAFMVIAVRISLPVVGALFILDVAMGLLVKAVPQMNVFVVGMPVKVLAGLLLLTALTPVVRTIYDYVFGESVRALTAVLRGLSP
ncbi:MAG: flagellar biosynthetic protein FliR [Firmicutes bacterium]|nr:flagellar biosynthetic protein FliR [Bacillota bacterium]